MSCGAVQSLKQKTRLEAVEEQTNSSNAHVVTSVCMLFCCVHVTKVKSSQIKTEDDILLSSDLPPGIFMPELSCVKGKQNKTKQKYFMK